MRAILIDPHTETIKEIDLVSPDDMRAEFRRYEPQFAGLAELVRLGGGVALWVDEEGNLSDGRPVWTLTNIDGDHKHFTGVGIMTCADEFGEVEPLWQEITPGSVRTILHWTTLCSTGTLGPDSEYEEIHPVWGKVLTLHRGDPIFRERDPK
jgi:hypothetical protein